VLSEGNLLNMPECKNCQKEFIIESDDRAYHERINVPAPLDCPDCRRQQRLAWRCDHGLYFRKCDLCGKECIATYSPKAPFPVYCLDCFYSDKWDRLANGRDFDFNRSFFKQFDELQHLCPHQGSLVTRGTVFNSDYCHATTSVKNCYLCTSATKCEDCYYSTVILNSNNLFDCTETYESEKCYDCISCDQNYNLIGSENCKGCHDGAFLWDCSGCHDCFGCTNLRNQKYYLWNQPLSEEEYKREITKIDLRSRQIYDECFKKLIKLKKNSIHKYYQGFNNGDCSGDYLIRCKNAKVAFDCLEVEDCKYVTCLRVAKDCVDVDYWGAAGQTLELCYQCSSTGGGSYNNKFCGQVWGNARNLEYCDMCQNDCLDCFGCTCIDHKQYCILNKQYSKNEYFKLKDKIIEYMKKTGEYGQFFPPSISRVLYVDSLAQEYGPLTKEQILAKGWRWEDADKKDYLPATAELPDSINDIGDKIIKEIFCCERCGRNYKIISQELKFYKEINLPLPKFCFSCRILDRLSRKNKRQLFNRLCTKCGKELQTTYAPDRPEKIYCEECYQKEIY